MSKKAGTLHFNNMLVGGLIMATEPLLAVLLLRQLGFPPWQYGLAFAAPCVGGLIGSRLARRVVARYGQFQIIRTVGTLRAIWLIGFAVVRPGIIGLATVIAVEFAIIISMSLYNPVLATYRLGHTPPDRVARTLSAWSINSSASIAIFSALGGLLADAPSPRTAFDGRGTAHPGQPVAAAPSPQFRPCACGRVGSSRARSAGEHLLCAESEVRALLVMMFPTEASDAPRGSTRKDPGVSRMSAAVARR